MHYVAIVDGEERQVEVIESKPDTFVVVIDGRRLELDAHALGPKSYSLLDVQTHANHTVELEQQGTCYKAHLHGQSVALEVLDLRRMNLRRAQQSSVANLGIATITAPMPGKVVAVLVKEGQEVEANAGLVVVEAMKMENELRAPKAGVVREISAQVGAAVESGAVLCVIE